MRGGQDATVGIVICEDIWQDGGPVSQMDDANIQLLVVLNGSPFEEGKGHVRRDLAARSARARSRRPSPTSTCGAARTTWSSTATASSSGADGRMLASSPGFDGRTCCCGRCRTTTTRPQPGEVAPHTSDDEQVYTRDRHRACATTCTRTASVRWCSGVSGGIDSALDRRHRGRCAWAARTSWACRCRRRSRPSTPRTTPRTWPSASARTTGSSRSRPWSTRSRTQLALDGRRGGEPAGARARRHPHGDLQPRGPHGDRARQQVRTCDRLRDHLRRGQHRRLRAPQGRGQVARVGPGAVAQRARGRSAARRRRSRRTRSPSRRAPSCAPARRTRTRCPPTTCSTRCSTPTWSTRRAAPSCSRAASTRRSSTRCCRLVDRAEWKRRQYPPGPKVTALAFGRDAAITAGSPR